MAIPKSKTGTRVTRTRMTRWERIFMELPGPSRRSVRESVHLDVVPLYFPIVAVASPRHPEFSLWNAIGTLGCLAVRCQAVVARPGPGGGTIRPLATPARWPPRRLRRPAQGPARGGSLAPTDHG